MVFCVTFVLQTEGQDAYGGMRGSWRAEEYSGNGNMLHQNISLSETPAWLVICSKVQNIGVMV